MKSALRPVVLALTSCACIAAAAAHDKSTEPAARHTPAVPGWWKGNTHAHTWWSDGDSPPELVSAWYRERGYHFLVLSDHNRMQEGEFWYRVDNDQKRDALAKYRERFGLDWVESREKDGITEVKLKPLDEFRSWFEARDQFVFIRGMEITDRHQHHPVHLNGVNLEKVVDPQGGASVAEILQRNIDAVIAQGAKTGRPAFAHVNHPNFRYAVTAEDLVALEHKPGEGFVEVYNGHSDVHNDGDTHHPPTERMWDIVLARRLSERRTSVMYGVATDDAHEYTRWGLREVNPGRGWVMVRAPRLTPDTISAAMKRGDFYNSTGVTLRELAIDAPKKTMYLEILPEAGQSYVIEFLGTRKGVSLDGKPVTAPAGAEGRVSLAYGAGIGEVLERVEGVSARYEARGDEIYVRARVTSSRLHPNPFAEGDREMAWTQPLVVIQ
jgi:hypothetical protein